MTNIPNNPKKKNRIGRKITVFIFSFSLFTIGYYQYYSFSLENLKKEYRADFLQIKGKIVAEINDAQERGEIVNINRIIEPYLNNGIDHLVVYDTNREIVQAFTKSGISQEDVYKFDRVYSELGESISNIYFWEKPNSLLFKLEENNSADSLLIMTVIIPRKIPYYYLLLFNHSGYLKARISLEAIVNRNTFYTGLLFLGVLIILFLIRDKIRLHGRNNQEKFDLVSKKNKTKPIPPNSSVAASGLDSEEKNYSFPNNSNESKSTKIGNLNDDAVEYPLEKSEPSFFQKQEKTLPEKEVKIIFDSLISPSPESEYREINQGQPIDYSNTTPQDLIRPFEEILNHKEYLEKRRSSSFRLKKLLGTWLFSPTINQRDNRDSVDDLDGSLADHLVRRSLEVILNPIEPEEKPISGLTDYLVPSALLYFRPEQLNRDVRYMSHRPLLIHAVPLGLYQQETDLFTVPWLGKEKRFFKRNLPYEERKSDAVALVSTRMIGGEPHIIKSLFPAKEYDRILYEPKLHLLYLINVLFDCISGFEGFHDDLFHPSRRLEEKAKKFFDYIFRLDPAAIQGVMENPSGSALHFSLWILDDSHSFKKDPEIKRVLANLPDLLNRKFYSQEVVFLSDLGPRMLSLGYEHSTPEKEDEGNINETIRSAIEKILIEQIGLAATKINWQEIPLLIPENRESKIIFPDA